MDPETFGDEPVYPDDDDLESRVEELEAKLAHEGSSSGSGVGCATLYGFGTPLAMILSWSKNGSILWCIAHGLASWFYVIYFALTRPN